MFLNRFERFAFKKGHVKMTAGLFLERPHDSTVASRMPIDSQNRVPINKKKGTFLNRRKAIYLR